MGPYAPVESLLRMVGDSGEASCRKTGAAEDEQENIRLILTPGRYTCQFTFAEDT